MVAMTSFHTEKFCRLVSAHEYLAYAAHFARNSVYGSYVISGFRATSSRSRGT